MKFFKRNNPEAGTNNNSETAGGQAALAKMALEMIQDGVIITDKNGVIQFINPAGATMSGVGTPDKAIGLDYGLVIRIESKEGRTLSDAENPLVIAMKSSEVAESFQCSIIVGQSDKRIPVAISVLPPEGHSQNRIIVFRNIAKELQKEGEQTEFISTASHEMRTPVATIDGYLSLALNPQTASIDERARGYLTSAQAASKHLGKLFQDLLDVTKLDDGHIRPHFEPVEVIEYVRNTVNDYLPQAKAARLNLRFGSDQAESFGGGRKIQQVAYGFIDQNFMREILDNLIDNAIKYTPAGGSIYVNVRGDGDRVLINVTDTGVGISADDLAHVFQKFYRVDNSDTRTIGGTGLGLYLVKQRAEAMGGRVWAESAFGEGSTFYVSLPRLSQSEYEKRMIAVNNWHQAQPAPVQATTPVQPTTPIQPTAPMAPTQPTAPAVSAQPTTPAAQTQPAVSTQPTAPVQPQPTPPAPTVAAASDPPQVSSPSNLTLT